MKSESDTIVQLIHIQGPLKGQIQEFSGPSITIGRNPSCNVQFSRELSAISRNHAEIVLEGDRFKLIDRSTNGTFVNGQKVNETYLRDGDILMFSPEGPKLSFLVKSSVKRAAAEPPAGDPFSRVPQHKAEVRMPGPLKEEIPVTRVQVPLIVQYGPALKSFRELPVSIGKGQGNNLTLPHPAIADRHALIFFTQGEYWVRDLTGTRCITINGSPVEAQTALHTGDILALSPQGPFLRFLGEGRLAECSDSERIAQGRSPAFSEQTPRQEEKRPRGGFRSLRDIFKR